MRVFFASLFIFIILLSFPAFCTANDLQSIYDTKTSSAVRKHLKLAIELCRQSRTGSYKEEINVLMNIDPDSAAVYGGFLNDCCCGSNSNSAYSPSKSNTAALQTPVPADDKVAVFIAEKIKKAMVLYSKSDLSRTKAVLEDVLAMDKGNTVAVRMISAMEAEEFEMDDSKPFQSIVKEMFEQGMAFYRRDMQKDAVSKFKKAYETDPTNAQVKKYMEMSEEKLSASLDEENCDKILDRADKLRLDGDIKHSRELYEKIISILPANKKAAFNIQEYKQKSLALLSEARNAIAAGNMQGGLELSGKAVDADPLNEEAVAMEKEMRMKTAELKLRDKEKKRSAALYNKGVTFYSKGEYAKAINAWRSVLEIDPADKEAGMNIDKAEQKLKENSEKSGDETAKAVSQASELQGQGRLAEARNMYEYALRLSPDNKAASDGLAKVSEMMAGSGDEKVVKR
jgi:tetratricopeptide (TPR) repeat protein